MTPSDDHWADESLADESWAEGPLTDDGWAEDDSAHEAWVEEERPDRRPEGPVTHHSESVEIREDDKWSDGSLREERPRPVQISEADERRVNRAFRFGAAAGLVIFLIILTGARTTMLSWAPVSDFYDAQADSFLEGRLDIDPERLGIEGFESDGKTYMYQPPWPAILRLPVAAVTDSFDGRLGQLSLLGALLVSISATRRLLVHARRSIRPGASVTRFELGTSFSLGLIVAGGSVPLFLATRPWVYHESAMWGTAWTLAALAALVGHRRDPGWGSLALVFGATLAAVGSRASVGAGACAAIGLTAVAVLAGNRRRRPLRQRLGGPAGAVALLLAAGVPALLYGALNVAKFDTVTSIPWEEQAFSKISPARQAMLEENDGTLFGIQFAPTTLLHYLRPNGVDLTAEFPFVDFPPPGGPVVGEVTFDLVDRTASIPASLPALVLPSAVGLWALARRRTLHDPVAWRAVAAGAAVGTLTIIPFGYVAHRYLADVMPLLVVLAALGVQSTCAAIDATDLRRGERAQTVGWLLLLLLVPVTVWSNIALATTYQRLYVPTAHPDLVAGLVDARLTIGAEPDVIESDTLPGTASVGDLAAVDDCAALYIWDGTAVGEFRSDAWVPVERTEAAGHIHLRVTLPRLTLERRYPLVAAPRAGVVAWIQRQPDRSVVAGIDGASGTDSSLIGLPAEPAGRDGFDVVLDPFSGEATIRLGDEILVTGALPRGTDVTDLAVGSSGGIPGFEPNTPTESAGAGDDGSLCRRAVG